MAIIEQEWCPTKGQNPWSALQNKPHFRKWPVFKAEGGHPVNGMGVFGTEGGGFPARMGVCGAEDGHPGGRTGGFEADGRHPAKPEGACGIVGGFPAGQMRGDGTGGAGLADGRWKIGAGDRNPFDPARSTVGTRQAKCLTGGLQPGTLPNSKFMIPHKRPLGWVVCGLRVTRCQAVISLFSRNLCL